MSIPATFVPLKTDVSWVGVRDWHRTSFDCLLPLPYGTTYNSYLVAGKEKTALVDTVLLSFSQEHIAKLRALVDLSRLDYIVMDHAEPDHASSINQVLEIATGAKLLVSEKGLDMARLLHHVPAERCTVVKDGDRLYLGGKTLRFVYAPWLHWPETMFTFIEEDRILFSCDFFGAHVASDRLFDDEVGDHLLPEAKTYYSVIMMPYSKMAIAGLDKALALDPAIIAPSHGPVYRNPQRVMKAYESWTRGPLHPKVEVVFASMWGSTHKLAHAVSTGLSAEGVEGIPYNLATCDLSHMTRDLVDSAGLAVGSPTVIGGLHPVVANGLLLVRTVKPRAMLGAFFGSYGWGGGAASQARAGMESLKMEVVEALDVKGTPLAEDLERAVELGRALGRRVKESLASAVNQ